MRIVLLCLPLALAGCSLINAYDEVVGSGGGGAGAGPAGGGGAGTGGEPTSGGGGATGGSGGTGGEGGAPPPPLLCSLDGPPIEIEDLSTATGNSRTYQYGGTVHQLNGDNGVIAVQNGQTVRLLFIEMATGNIQNEYAYPDSQILFTRPIDDKLGVLIQNTGGNPPTYALELLTADDGGGNQVTVTPISNGTFAPGYGRGLFVPIGPGLEDIALLLRYDISGVQHVVYGRKSTPGTEPTRIELPGPFANSEAASPKGIVVQADGTVHAFAGNPDLDGFSGTKRFTFDESDGNVGPGVPLGPGIIVTDLLKRPNGLNVAFGKIAEMELTLHSGRIQEADLSTIDVESDFPAVISFSSFLDVPTNGEAKWLADSFYFFGTPQTRDRLVLLLSDEDGLLRFHSDELYVSPDGFDLGDLGALTSQQPLADFGGLGTLLWAETEPDAIDGAFDHLMMGTLLCEPQE